MEMDSSSDEEDTNEYMLGFAEKVEPITLLRHHFPSKIGGRPAWLDPVHLPTREQLTCRTTGQRLNFLLQGSAVTNPGGVRAFRCQLPRQNIYYSYHPPVKGAKSLPPALTAQEQAASLAQDPWRSVEVETIMASGSSQPLAPSHSSDGSATEASAGSTSTPPGTSAPQGSASREHPAGVQAPLPGQEAAAEGQAQGSGHAAQEDQGESSTGGGNSGGGKLRGQGVEAHVAVGDGKEALFLYPEMELVVEPEEMGGEEHQEAMHKLMRDYEAKVAVEGELSEDELPMEVLDQVEEANTMERRHFAMFQARVQLAPGQNIRYCFQEGAIPQWPSPHGLPRPSDIPPCQHCGRARRFEFQVLPQLLNHLAQDELSDQALDWGTIVVYSCPGSCVPKSPPQPPGSAYVEEFVWVQPPV